MKGMLFSLCAVAMLASCGPASESQANVQTEEHVQLAQAVQVDLADGVDLVLVNHQVSDAGTVVLKDQGTAASYDCATSGCLDAGMAQLDNVEDCASLAALCASVEQCIMRGVNTGLGLEDPRPGLMAQWQEACIKYASKLGC